MSSAYEASGEAEKHLTEALRRLPDSYLACRSMAHAWSVLNEFRPVGKTSGRVEWLFRDLVCMRCEMVRIEEYRVLTNGRMVKEGQRYHRPTGYDIAGVPRGVKPAQIVQAEMYRRAMERVAKAQPGERERAE